MSHRALFVALAIAALGCAPVRSVYVTDDGQAFDPIAPERVRLHHLGTIEQPYSIVGRVSVLVHGEDGDAALAELADVAAMHGADLVMEVQLFQVGGSTGAKGLAVRTK